MEKYIRLTKKKIEETFEACNERYFNREIPKPVFFELWTPDINILGMVRPIPNMKKHTIESALHISNKYNWTQEDLEEVVIHEMIHLYNRDYIEPKRWWHFFLPPKQHDKRYISKMQELNAQFGLNIAVKIPRMKSKLKQNKRPSSKPSHP